MKSHRAFAVLAAVIILLFLNAHARSLRQDQVSNGRGVSSASNPVIVKPTTGNLIVRVYADSGGHYDDLIAKKGKKDSYQYGVQVYVDETAIGPPPLREPLPLIPGGYRVSVAYPNGRNGYFSITTKQVKVAPGGGVVLDMQPQDREWSRGGFRNLFVDVRRVEERASRKQLIEHLDYWQAFFKDVPDRIDRVRSNKYFQQLAAQYEQLSSRVMLTDLDAYDEDAYKPSKVNLEIDSEQIRWVGRSIKDEYNLDNYSD